jgi:hypothetical protein
MRVRSRLAVAAISATLITVPTVVVPAIAQAQSNNCDILSFPCSMENLRPFFLDEFGANMPLVTENNTNVYWNTNNVVGEAPWFEITSGPGCWNYISSGQYSNDVVVSSCNGDGHELFRFLPCPDNSWCIENYYIRSTGRSEILDSSPADGAAVFFSAEAPDADSDWQFNCEPGVVGCGS